MNPRSAGSFAVRPLAKKQQHDRKAWLGKATYFMVDDKKGRCMRNQVPLSSFLQLPMMSLN